MTLHIYRLLVRLQYLCLEYPEACFLAAILPAVGIALPEVLLISEGCTPLPGHLLVPLFCLWFVGAVGCMHPYDLARQRVQKLAERLDICVQIERHFCFSPPQLQAGYEQWRQRAVFWHSLDYLPMLFMLATHVKLLWMKECRSGVLWYEVWALGLSVPALYKLANRTRLSACSYSMLSMTSNVFNWVTHCTALLISGDPCFGRLGRGLFRGSIASQTCMSCAAFVMVYLCTPVSQAYVPLKTAIGFLGGVTCAYMHMLYRDGAVDPTADAHRVSFFWMFVATTLACVACFHVSTRLSEEGMGRYVAALRTHAATRGGGRPAWDNHR